MLLSLQNVDFGYSEITILNDINLTINDNDRIAIIGANGSGKTTLIKLLLGDLIPTNGDIFRKSGLKIGYLAQNCGSESPLSVYDELMSVFQKELNAINTLTNIATEMANTSHKSEKYITLEKEYTKLESYIYASDAYNIDYKVKSVMQGLGFVDRSQMIVKNLSGGEKTRLALAKLLLSNIELLLLDEPTNHLDTDTLAFLEKYLANYKGSLVVISHDRYFIDKVANKVWDLVEGDVHTYVGNYTISKQLKAERIARQLKEYEKQTLDIQTRTEYAKRNMARASTSKSARSRLKQIANMELIEKPITYVKTPRFQFETLTEPVKAVLSIKNYELTIGDRILVDDINLNVTRGERIAILGANGTGKTTLIRKIVQQYNESFNVTSNPITFGKGVKLSYYDQENTNLDPNNTVLDELWNRYRTIPQHLIRAILGGLLLDQDDMNKKVSELSGGERAKLAYSILIAEKGNVMILDEPTNHIDLSTRDALEKALNDFQGTLIFVSHDRYFVNCLATKIFEINNRTINEYSCNYDEFIAKKKEEDIAIELAQREIKEEKSKKVGYRTANMRKNTVKLKMQLTECEKEISQLETKETSLTADLANPEISQNFMLLQNICKELELTRNKLSDKLVEWENIASELEEC